MKTYTTIAGDKWDGIAFKELGNCNKLDILIKENIKHKDIYIFPAGVVLNIPEVEETINQTLPPWKASGDNDS